MSMEFTQSFVDRVTDINDVIANGSGALMGAFAGAMIIYGYRNRKAGSKAQIDETKDNGTWTAVKDNKKKDL